MTRMKPVDSRMPDGIPTERLDLVATLFPNPGTYFYLPMQGNAMTGAGIYDGTLLIVDTSLEPKSGNIVVAVVDGEPTVRRLTIRNKTIELTPENPKYKSIRLDGVSDLIVRGVVKHFAHFCRPVRQFLDDPVDDS